MGLSKIKRECQIEKWKKKAVDIKNDVKQQKKINKKNKSTSHWSCSAMFAFVRVRGRCGVAFAGSSINARRRREVLCRCSSLLGRACGPRGHHCWCMVAAACGVTVGCRVSLLVVCCVLCCVSPLRFWIS